MVTPILIAPSTALFETSRKEDGPQHQIWPTRYDGGFTLFFYQKTMHSINIGPKAIRFLIVVTYKKRRDEAFISMAFHFREMEESFDYIETE